MTHAGLKPSIDLIPETCWYKSLRKHMKQCQWDKLRKKAYSDQGNLCWVCCAAGRLNCHEVWSYDEERRIQRLMGFHAVCSMCHHVTHFGLAQILAGQGHLDLEAVIEHLLKVNRVGRDEFEAHETEAFGLWRERSKHEWQTNLGEWAAPVEQENAEPGAAPDRSST